MTEPISRLLVERVDALRSRAQWIFVTGVLSGEPVHIGDTLTVQHAGSPTDATIRTIEIHTAPGKTTIALDAELKPIIVPGTIIERPRTP
ncbi:hypothetical protein KO481_10385 [Nocardia sp. NEAU-G5]|uniref:Uncharacterized protein n=1 Tax=Nocardia albiluteola TaxID=2842303 RepID=A0ABS6AV76_9NOCA|nr:hypothetical protein [Nocardia albiluteola]MBU3061932.1 hypothetical protein [Nocardia albiluteola]